LLVTVNNRLILEIEIVHDLSCHPILRLDLATGAERNNISDLSITIISLIVLLSQYDDLTQVRRRLLGRKLRRMARYLAV